MLIDIINCHYFSEQRYEIFDVYNNGIIWGGKLQKTNDGYFIVKSNGQIQFYKTNNQPKAFKRKFFDDVTLRIGLGVNINFIKNDLIFLYVHVVSISWMGRKENDERID